MFGRKKRKRARAEKALQPLLDEAEKLVDRIKSLGGQITDKAQELRERRKD
jgi:predicted  nucleic acid-binding Zn-ribbon protein